MLFQKIYSYLFKSLYLTRIVILGDRVVSVNGEFIAGKSYAEVVQLIQSTKEYLQLSVVPQQDDILQMVSNSPFGY